jgi:hypothetical protein
MPMSLSLYLFDLTQAALPAPLTLPQMGTLLDVLGEREPGVNLRFTQLGQRLEQAASGNGLRWPNSPAKEALTVTSALWHLELPAPQNAQTVQLVAQLANELGLYAYCDQIGIGFLPDKRIFPASSSVQWHAMLESDQSAAPTPAAAQPPFSAVVALMTERFTQLLAPHGFTLAAQTPTTPRINLRFERPIAQGRHCVDIWIGEHEDRDANMVRSCTCKFQVFHDAVSRTEMPFESLHNGPAFYVDACFFGGPQIIDSPDEIEALLLCCERRGLPLLDFMPDLAGLDQVFHAPSSDLIRAKDCKTLRHHRQPRLASLAVAWLNGNPHFEQLAQQHLQTLTVPSQKRDVVEGWLESLQRSTPRLRTWADEAHWLSSHRPVPAALTAPLPEDPRVPRLHHAEARKLLTTRPRFTLSGPNPQADEQFAALRQAIADRFVHENAARSFREFWDETAEKYPPDLRIPADGLDAVLVNLPVPSGEHAQFVCLTFPAAIRPSETHFIALNAHWIFELRNENIDQPSGPHHSLSINDVAHKTGGTRFGKFTITREAFLQACAQNVKEMQTKR